VREFRVDIPETQLDDLRRRLALTRWPEAATVDGWTQGVPLDYAKELCAYWADEYDWRRCEAELNALPQFVTGLDGGGDDALDIHFLHVRSPHENATPLLLTHGWPGSVIEFLDVVDALTNPPEPAQAFHVVAPSLPGYGFSAKPTVAGWGVERIAIAWAQLMDRLGYERWGAAGGDWGSIITSALGTAAPDGLMGIHLTMPVAPRPPDGSVPPLTEAEQAAVAEQATFRTVRSGYSAEQSTRPQTIGYGLLDSPSAQCTWIVEKFWDWTDCAGHPENVITRDRLLDNVMLYWLPGNGASSARLYWESFGGRRRNDEVTVPTGVTLFPHELYRLPRSWIETRYTDLRHFTEQKTGGHFASMEQPEVYVHELRTYFRTLT
jgi:pimeloyl-ACP methyl ester carboxylesterase